MNLNPAQAVERVMLQSDGAHREFRELILYHYGGSLFMVWESVAFASNPDAKTQYQLQIGSKSEIERLCDGEGFTIIEGFTIVR